MFGFTQGQKLDRVYPSRLASLALAILSLLLIAMPAQALKIAQIKHSPDQQLGGMLLAEIYKRAEIPLELVPLPGARAILSSNSGLLDGEQMRIYQVGDLYPNLVRVPTPFIYFEPSAFSYRENISIVGWNSLAPFYTAYVRGMKFAEQGLNNHSNLLVLDNNQLMFNLLKHRRLDVAVTTKFSGLYQINLMQLTQIKPLTPPLEIHQLYHYLHKSKQDYVPILDRVIREMRDSGELTALRNQYYLELLMEAKRLGLEAQD